MHETARLILERSLLLWSARGYDAVGVQEIVSQSGVSKPTLYHHFGSKEGLLSSLFDWKFPLLVAALSDEALNRVTPLKLRVQNVAHVWFTVTKAEFRFLRLYLATTFSPPESPQTRKLKPWVNTLYSRAALMHGDQGDPEAIIAGAALLGLLNTYSGLYLADETNLADGLAAELAIRHARAWTSPA